MRLDNMLPYRALGLGVALLGVASRAADDLSQSYCSSQNTADDSTFVSNIYQSNGACYDTCKGSYAFAVVQYQSCWCSNDIPADQEDVGSCNQDCPGYPAEKCGNQGSGLYGYVPLPNAPSGTAGASSASSTTSSQQVSIPCPHTT
ncbi:Cell wall integrity and stress response component 4 [Pseudocercospora fuligena]|uniref:Cell wall integrity and stress response component 4 n=1 Tax=Pseudocercospora fuligena TaxID=685502 RepID=A0A8H6RKH1_9PEZI|nr:Cell wall integrity and stress response component 4 [Pseudocercospora fuligena]